MTFDPTQETLEEYLRRRSLVPGACSLRLGSCDLALDELILLHGQRKKGTAESKVKPFGYDETIHVGCPLYED